MVLCTTYKGICRNITSNDLSIPGLTLKANGPTNDVKVWEGPLEVILMKCEYHNPLTLFITQLNDNDNYEP